MKKLYLMRHAKAENNPEISDHQRNLHNKAEQQCQIAAQVIKEINILPSLIISSDAVRTHETAKKVAQYLGNNPKIESNKKLYMSSEDEMLDIIIHLPENIETAMIVAHNPTIHKFAIQIAQNSPNNHLLAIDFPPASFVLFECDIKFWADIRPSKCNLFKFLPGA